jgi:hypothetical protein
MFLRQSTASQEILLGRFVDSADGDTEETGLTIANTDIKLFKEGATTLADKNSGGATHIANGLYYAVLDATDTDTVGNLEVHVHAAGALAIKREYAVLPAAVYDALVAGSALADSVPADGTVPTWTQALYMLTQFMLERSVSGTTVTVKKVDGSTSLFTLTLNDGTNPTSITRAT